ADAQHGAPLVTFSLAMATLPEAHWSALMPTAPLRRWRLLDLGSGTSLTTSPLRISEAVLHFLLGVPMLSEPFLRMLEPVQALASTPSSLRHEAARIAEMWRHAGTGRQPLIHLFGSGYAAARQVAAHACAAIGLALHALPAWQVPQAPGERDTLAVLWERDAALHGSALLVEFDDLDGEQADLAAAARFVEQTGGLLLVASRERRRFHRSAHAIELGLLEVAEQRQAWEAALGPAVATLNGQLDQIVNQFTLDAGAIDAVAREARRSAADGAGLARALWSGSRLYARHRLDDLAQRIEPIASWDDLVLPDAQLRVLHDLAGQVRQRATVYETWGFGKRGARGLGISALFSGPSGTGKTTAAEVLAGELDLDLYRIDLAGVVSKYIGETEKNLRRVFDAAEQSGAVLLFDEADAIFGKRSEVKDSHDRYANIEVGYLLQRMETYRGLVILTTNLKHTIDQAFLRRIRFVVQFAFPDAAQRAELWRKSFPPATPLDGLDYSQLARLNIAGGNIRTIALNAAFMAADAAEPVRMQHVLRAARVEYAKLEKPLTESEIAGWTT
ncbi:MAG TPA: ATP-binding protein, partial [Roseiflexaceae bacterium]|nr:ATP-binding protein [Roseiflexaceae bacterium]